MIIDPSNLICPKCLKSGYVNYIGQSYKYIAKCYNCGFYFEIGDFLKEVSEKKTNNVTTNADRTRHMSDEELAKWISNIAYCSDCPIDRQCPINAEQCQGNKIKCYLAWLEWLKSEA